jgi:redox-sensitive bicupin YhaK (pirin superfamily)
MLTLRKSDERGHFDHGWLKTYHTFSFADYHDDSHVHFRALRVINEDTVAPGKGFGTHPHRDMEIITYILSGSLEHKDSMGNGSVIRPGDVQYMSAGTGVLHSEFNPSATEGVHLLQIWILPNAHGLTPLYGQKNFSEDERMNALKLIASPNGDDGSVTIRQDVDLYASILDVGQTLPHTFEASRFGWLQLTSGELVVNDTAMKAGDGLSISEEKTIEISSTGNDRAEFLLFDLN